MIKFAMALSREFQPTVTARYTLCYNPCAARVNRLAPQDPYGRFMRLSPLALFKQRKVASDARDSRMGSVWMIVAATKRCR